MFIVVQFKHIYKVINDKCLSSPSKKSRSISIKLQTNSRETDSINRRMKNIQEEVNEEIEKEKEMESIKAYCSAELNEMEFEDVKQHDRRNFCKYYIDICIQKQLILSITFNGSLFYPITLRITLFIFSMSMLLFFNAIFYTDEYISKRASMTGDLGFLYKLENEFEKSIYASLITMALGKLLSMVTSIGLDYYKLLRNQNDHHFQFKVLLLVSEMKKRMIIVGVAVFLFNIVFWYFLFIFCTIYQNNQIGWIESAFISIAINMLIPMYICFIIAVLRYIGLCCKST